MVRNKKLLLIAGFGLLATSASLLYAPTGQEAFCVDRSHGGGGWSSLCSTNPANARKNMEDHIKAYPSHKGEVTTRPCNM